MDCLITNPQDRIPRSLTTLLQFTQNYHSALEGCLDRLGRDTLPHHGDRTEIVAILMASDAVATFYLPAPDDPSIERGYHVSDLSDHDLNRVCQSVSVHRLQVAPPLLGERWDKRPPIISHVEPISDFAAPWIHQDIRAAAISGDLKSLPGITISPVVRST